MRWYSKAMVLAALAFVVVELSTAQQPAQTGGFGKGASNPATLIQNESVKKELRLTDEQLAKVPDAIMKALAEVLDSDQMKRLKQIELQVKGSRAFAEPAVQTSLKMSSEQKDNIQSILADADKDIGELTKEIQKEFKSGNVQALQALRDKMTANAKETKVRCTSVLSADQKRTWQEMIGDSFKLESPKFDFGKK
jgi:hypothetical protein